MSEWNIEVRLDSTDEVVKTLSYASQRSRDKAYGGLIANMNLSEYTAYKIDPINLNGGGPSNER